MTTPTLPRNILVVGSGGREHALVTALLKSPSNPHVICAPGNAGIESQVPCYPISADNIPGLVQLAKDKAIDFVVVGPEVPLSLGLVDELNKGGILAFGPKADGARLEASKTYTKEILLKYNIPTAKAAFFTNKEEAHAYIDKNPGPIVIKADGLAAGKGVVVASHSEEAKQAATELLRLKSGSNASPSSILIEECLTGEETSLLVIVSGTDYIILPTAQDHKRIGENDTGPNTGGMGAYSPASIVSEDLLKQIDQTIVAPSVQAIAKEGIDFRGTLFIGIMLTPEGPKVLEYNTRFGDPETQVVLPRLKTDLLVLLFSAATHTLGGITLEVISDVALCVVIAAKGYPGTYPKGEVITLLPSEALPPKSYILHAGTTKNKSNEIVSNGGRVLGIVALAATLKEAASKAYWTCDAITYPSKVFRRDIGARQLKRE
jgi:phosphoribosylamine---glycine ligase